MVRANLSLFSSFYYHFCSRFFRIGCQLVITAWLAVQLTGRANAVGTILLISSVTHLVCSPVIGKLVDTFKKRSA